MTGIATYREEYIRLLRAQQQRLSQLESDVEKAKASMGISYIDEIEALDEKTSFIKKALVMRRHYLELQRFKLKVQKEKTEMTNRHMTEILALKARWENSNSWSSNS